MTEKYTKADYLTPLKFAKKYNIDPELVKKAVEKARLRRTSITLANGGVPHEIVINTHGKYHIRPEPTAHAKIHEILQEIKGIQK